MLPNEVVPLLSAAVPAVLPLEIVVPGEGLPTAQYPFALECFEI